MAEWVDGTGRHLTGVHERDRCAGQWCVIHRPMPGPWEDWPTAWNDHEKLMYRICPCGDFHPAAEEQDRDWRVAVWHVRDCCPRHRCGPALRGDGIIDGEVVYHVIES